MVGADSRFVYRRIRGAMIPKIFHHVWINHERPALPEEFARYRATWLKHHPDWEFRLWTSDAIDFALQRADLLPQCASYAQVADILRLEILYRFGGVYVDADFECFRSIDALLMDAHQAFCSEDGRVISTGFIASTPGAPLVATLLAELPAQIGRRAPNAETGPAHVTRVLLRHGFGPGVRMIPSELLYPYSMGDVRATPASHPSAYAAHHWAHSWARPRLTGWRRIVHGMKRRAGLVSP